jgi:hypothetical protein
MKYLFCLLFCLACSAEAMARDCPDGTCFRQRRQAPRTERYSPDTAPKFDFGTLPEKIEKIEEEILPLLPESAQPNVSLILSLIGAAGGLLAGFVAGRAKEMEDAAEGVDSEIDELTFDDEDL